MSTLSLRLTESLHKKLRELAKQEGASINQLISTAVAEKVSALMTEEYLAERARRGSRKRFERVLSKVGTGEPDELDRLPEPATKERRRPNQRLHPTARHLRGKTSGR